MRVAVADDSVLIREGIRGVLTEAGMTCVGMAGDATALLALVDSERPDVVVTDIRMPPAFVDEGLRAADEIRARTTTCVLVLSQYREATFALRLLDSGHGGCGYLLKDRLARSGELAEAVRRVAAGELVVDPAIVDGLLERHRSDGRAALSSRELEVLSLVAQGYTDRVIAERLFLGQRTVETHVRHVLHKLDIAVGEGYNPRVRAALRYLELSQ